MNAHKEIVALDSETGKKFVATLYQGKSPVVFEKPVVIAIHHPSDAPEVVLEFGEEFVLEDGEAYRVVRAPHPHGRAGDWVAKIEKVAK